MTCQFAILEHEALLHIAGPDTLTFLQGQTTCDTRKVDSSTSLPGAYCTPKGRVVCNFLLSELAHEHYVLRMRRDIRDISGQTFGKYIIFSKAELDKQRDDWQVMACWGEGAGAALRATLGKIPHVQYGSCRGDGYLLVQLDEQGQQFECYLERQAKTDLLARIGECMTPASEQSWQALQIRAGVGRIEAATVEEFIPQMLNYDVTGRVSFDKGCYTGQEVVARMHYRGKSKRRMMLAQLPAGADAQAGTPVFGGSGEQSVGNIVNCATDEAGHWALLVATLDSVASGLQLAAVDGAGLQMGELPYPVDGATD